MLPLDDLLAEVALYIENVEARAEVHLPDVSADLCRDLRDTCTAMLEALEGLRSLIGGVAPKGVTCHERDAADAAIAQARGEKTP